MARLLFSAITTIMNRRSHREKEGGIGLNRFEFDFLTYLEKNGRGVYSQRQIADDLTITLNNTARLVEEMEESDYLNRRSDGSIEIIEKGLKELEPYKVNIHDGSYHIL